MSDTVAKLTIGDKTFEFPVLSGSVGPDVIDIRSLYAKTGMFTYDPGFTSTAATDSTQAEGVDKILLVPIGFVCDHVEVLFDVDIEHKQQAAELGIRLERTAMLNDDPGLVAAVANAVRQALAQPV